MSDRPSDGGGSARSDAASRLAALLADVVDDPGPPPPAPAPPTVALDDAPGRVVRRRAATTPPEPPDASPVVSDVTERPRGSAPAPAPPPITRDGDDEVLAEARASTGPPPDGAAGDGADDVPANGVVDDGLVDDGLVTAPRLTRRAVAFGVALALLVAAVPALGWVGKDRLLDSRGGVVVEGGTDASEPGYRALVNPTPTGLVVHRDPDGTPVSATVLSLGAADGGGTVLLMPLTLQIHEPIVFNTIIEAWEQTGDDDAFRRDFEDVIGVSVPPPIIDVTDESLATLVAPVAPLELVVNDPVVADDGTAFEGPVSLAADQVGPYMRATRDGEPEIARLERLRDVWATWLAAIGDAAVSEPIGGAVTGMGSFLRELADGEPVVETLDVEAGIPETFMQPPFYVPGPNMEEQVIDAIPFPVSPRAGRRFGIKLLNGAVGDTLPMPLMRDLVLAGGSLSTLGNADAFGQEETLIEYAGDDWRDEAEALQELLGETAEIDEMSARRAEAEAEDMVITIGSEVLSRYQDPAGGGG